MLVLKTKLVLSAGFLGAALSGCFGGLCSAQGAKQAPPMPAPALKTVSGKFGRHIYTIDGKSVSKKKYGAASVINDGLALLHANKNELALEKFKQGISLAPDLPQAHHALGLAYAKLGRLDEACTELKCAVALNPVTESAWLTLACFYQANDKPELAVAAYNDFLKKFPNSPSKRKVEAILSALGKGDVAFEPGFEKP
ncbi:MAG: tetratricopeptide repeat protein [Candidatus Obscuribacterales bacterium]|nr:tetratricopeptide repeat protein [Candidatus Obscuribacterales bacterium]